ncbi:MAG TPA: class I SAM-dependent methyltransferase [Phycisphaerae bacterium]|nr:class I SAM-dependent methyltransferase [Phycisphaerae bacterium]
MDEALYEEMYQLERHHWWFAAKRCIVLSLLKKFLSPGPSGNHPLRVADVGCGCGMMLSCLIDHGYDAVGIDSSDLALQFSRSRGVEVVRCEVPGKVDLPSDSVDAVLMLDVLEHIDDDAAAFISAIELVKPGGIAVCTVPAYSWLWTQRDGFHHHKRRYGRRRLVETFRAAKSAEIVFVSFMNTFLFPLALVRRLWEKEFGRKDKPTDLSIPPLGFNGVLQKVYQAERYLLYRRLLLPFGLSLVGVIRKL